MGLTERVRLWFSCWSCHGTNVRMVREVVPYTELSAAQRADVLVNGGYGYSLVGVPCEHQGPYPRFVYPTNDASAVPAKPSPSVPVPSSTDTT